MQRDEHAIFRVPEPSISSRSRAADKTHPLESDPAQTARFKYPDRDQNAEAILVHPKTGELYVVTKRISGSAGVYKIPSQFGGDVGTAVRVADISVPAVPTGLITGGSISPDGRRVILSDYVAAYEWTLPAGAEFDQIWEQPLVAVDIGRRDTGEAVCYSADGSSIFSTSEGIAAPIYRMIRK
jgi:hypothetical protein